MQKLPCPSCGGELSFRSSTSLFTVCPYCRSNVIRKDMDLEKIGEMADLPPDLSPIQIGTMGRYAKSKFYVAGRIIYTWTDGTWNEWYLLFDNGKTGWLSEAQGEFAVSFPMNIMTCPSESELNLGSEYTANKHKFYVSDIKSVRYIGSEGELPFKALSQYRSTVYDFSSKENLFLSMEFPIDKQEANVYAYHGKYVELSQLSLINKRMLEGWV